MGEYTFPYRSKNLILTYRDIITYIVNDMLPKDEYFSNDE